MILLLAFACGHSQVAWEFQPPPAVLAPLSDIVVVASGVECQAIANEFAMKLAMREGFTIHPEARTRLLLNMCSVESETRVVAGTPNETAVAKSAPSVGGLIGRGKGRAVLTVELDGRPVGMIQAEALRMQRSRDTDSLSSTLGPDIEQDVVADIASDLIRQLAPLPETVQRRWYRKPKPGSAKSLHNQAVEAERDGNFEEAVRLARQAAETARNRHTADYLRAVEARLKGG
jgi:hypothetical protein